MVFTVGLLSTTTYSLRQGSRDPNMRLPARRLRQKEQDICVGHTITVVALDQIRQPGDIV